MREDIGNRNIKYEHRTYKKEIPLHSKDAWEEEARHVDSVKSGFTPIAVMA